MQEIFLEPHAITIANYEKAVSRFCSLLPQKEHDAHMALGIADEYFELQEAVKNNDAANVKEEAGDMLWFISQFCNKNDISFSSLVQDILVELNYRNINANPTSPRISELINYCKARIANYSKSFSDDQIKLYAKESVAYVFNELVQCFGYEQFGNSLLVDEILRKNYEKLANRHGEKFNPDNGQNRDVAAEREILEK